MFHEIGLVQLLVLAALVAALYRIRKSLPGSALRAWHERRALPGARAQWHRLFVLEFTELLLAGIFFLVGGAKLIGRPEMVALFRDIGAGQWLRYLTGTLEVSGATLLIMPLLSAMSAVILGSVMIVATLIEFFVLHRPPVAALACLSAHTFVAWARVSHRHQSWLRPEVAARAATSALPGSIAARWHFPRTTRSPN